MINSPPWQASLPMYDFPEVRQATDSWWTGIADHLRRQGLHDVPEVLLHDVPVNTLWQADTLFLSQCCGFDVVFGHRDRLQVLLTTDWSAAGCLPGQYRSWVVVHEDSPVSSLAELHGSVAVINGPSSHSGMNALMAAVNRYAQDGSFFREIQVSGAHVHSLEFVRDGRAAVAAIDCVTYALLQQYRPAAVSGVRILQATDPATAHPYVTLADRSAEQVARMQTGLAEAFADPHLQTARDTLLLRSALFAAPVGYQAIKDNFQYDPRLLAVLALNDAA